MRPYQKVANVQNPHCQWNCIIDNNASDWHLQSC